MWRDIIKEGPFHFAWEVSGESPFLNKQIEEWSISRPLTGIKILHHIPITHSTVRKVVALIQGGAEVALLRNQGNGFPVEEVCIKKLREASITVFDKPEEVTGEYDFFLDCAARLLRIKNLKPPRKGYVELTRSGLIHYAAVTDKPVVSVDNSEVKKLETGLGTGDGVSRALKEVFKIEVATFSILLFGYGKVGSGIAHYLKNDRAQVTVIDTDEEALNRAKKHSFKVILLQERQMLRDALTACQMVLTATGIEGMMSKLFAQDDLTLFQGKILVNAGAEDEYGNHFQGHSGLLFKGDSINFANEVPTNTCFIDPTFVLHNRAILWIKEGKIPNGVHPVPKEEDSELLKAWYQLNRDVTSGVIE